MPMTSVPRGRLNTFMQRARRYYVGPFTFPFARSAPLTPYSEPGAAGQITFTDTNGIFSVSSGSILVSGTAVNNDGPLCSDGVRGPGTTFYVSTSSRTTITNTSNLGLSRTNNTSSAVIAGVHYTSSTAFTMIDNASNTGESITGSAGTHEFLFVARNNGGYIFMRDGGVVGGAWTLMWVVVLETTIGAINGKFRIIAGAQNFRMGGLSVFNLADYVPAFGSDYGYATDHLISPAALTTYRHEANCWLEFTIPTLPSAGNLDVHFRKQDANNYWIARVNSAGDFSLQEVVAGSATQRANTAAIVAAGNRIVLIVDGSTIKGFTGAGVGGIRWTYASASNFATATSGQVNSLGTGGVVSDLAVYPRTFTAAGL
jgi:hypothetical protein